MPALVAARPDNRTLKAKGHASAGKPEKHAKVALTAIMQKLVVLTDTLKEANRKGTPRTA